MRKRQIRKLKEFMGLIILFLFIYLFSNFFNWFNQHKGFIALFIIGFLVLLGWLWEDYFNNFLQSLFYIFIFLVGLGVVGSWLSGASFYGLIITNDIMQIVLIAVYVIFTILNVVYFKKNAELSRLPYLKIDLDRNYYDLKLYNKSKYVANHIKIKIALKELKDNINLKKKIIYYFKDESQEKIDFIIERIEPNDKAIIKFREIIKKITNTEIKEDNIYDDSVYYKAKNKLNINKKYVLEIRYIYSTDMGFKLPEEIAYNFYFNFDENENLIIKDVEHEFGDAEEI